MTNPVSIHLEPAATSLVFAVIASSDAPLVLLDGDLTVIAASASFCRAFQIDPAQVPGKRVSTLGQGEWDVPQLVALLEATASGLAEVHAYEFRLIRHGQSPRLLVLNAHRLAYENREQTRLLLAAVDVTDARANDQLKESLLRDKVELIREKAVLLQEVQHRVANSLQIIASILMQSARKVQSDETSSHLKDAHGRLMSIASVQRQLATSGLGQVELRSYFTQLCKNLGASMIRDHKQLTIEVVVDDSSIDADNSMSLGLIVTELVINALKHAFPADRGGKIFVTYKSDGGDWTLSVTDNGIGMPADPADAKPGLGTNIIEALAKRLGAEVQVANANPGTAVSIAHSQIAVAPIGEAA